MKRPDLRQIHEVMKRSGMVVFDTPFSVTLGGIRTMDNAANTFNDFLFASFFTKNGGLHGCVIEGTTDAGLYYRENPMQLDGTAIIKHGVQHKSAFQYQNPAVDPKMRGHMGKEAFRQVKPMSYWRDADRNKYLNFDGKEEFDIFNTNGHDMGTVGKTVDKWSAGCWGSTEENMDILYDLALFQTSHDLGNMFSFAMLHENMF